MVVRKSAASAAVSVRRRMLSCALASMRGHVLADHRQHALEQRERLVLIFVDRRLLGIGAQVHDLAQRVERREMLLPVMVERSAAARSFRPGVQLSGSIVARPCPSISASASACSALVEHFGIDRFLLHPVVDRRRRCRGRRRRAALSSCDVPLLGIGVRRAGLADDRVDRLGAHVGDDVADRRRRP